MVFYLVMAFTLGLDVSMALAILAMTFIMFILLNLMDSDIENLVDEYHLTF